MSMLSLRIRRAVLATLIGISASLVPAGVSHAQPANYLIKGSESTVYYFSSNGKRYFFPSESVFKTWYPDFTSVAQITDAQLAQIPLAGNVTYRPGSTLVKITTDPKVYAVSQYGVLHWVKTETVAAGLYGLDWNTKVVDVSDAFFPNYIIGYDLEAPNQYSRNEALATAVTPEDNIRPANYLPDAKSPIPPGTIENQPAVEVSVSASQAVQNQTVSIDATVSDSILPITKIVIRAEGVTAPYATCLNTTDCYALFTVMTTPLTLRFYAEATDANGTVHATPAAARPTVTAATASNQISVNVTPFSGSAGVRISFSSDASAVPIVGSHKIYALIPGEPTPVLWKDCGTATTCAASTPFYRTTSLYAQVLSQGQLLNSPSATITISGEAPKPTLSAKSQTGSLVTLAVTAPYGETIGNTFIVEGTDLVEDPTIAMCDKATCEITIQVQKAASYTAFTWVGGKAEASNVITVTP